MHHILFLQDLAVVMIAAGLATILFRQLKQPVVLGYILAGVIIGPHTPPFTFIGDEKTIETLAELGVIFLMFSLGLEFSLRKLKEVGSTAVVAASLEIFIMIWAGYGLGQLFGWSQMNSIFLGAILSISSTTIIIKALEGRTREKFAQLIFGVLIIEDILAILLIALLSGFATTGEFAIKDISVIILNLAAFMGILLVSGLILVPRLLNYVSKFKSNEMLLITVVGLCFGVSFLTVKLGYSVALGAFLIGAIIAEARQIHKVEAIMFPVRDLFSAVFFVSIGLIIDPVIIIEYIVPIIAISLVVIAGKVFSCSLGSLLSGNDTKTSIKVGMGLSQIGEFSFIIAALGLTLNVTDGFIYPITVAVSALTTLTTPYLINSSDSFSKFIETHAPRSVIRTMEAYYLWVNKPSKEGPNHAGRMILRRIFLQICLNLLIITGIFIAFVFLNEKIKLFIGEYITGIEITKAILWFMAMLISFPLIFAVWRKTLAASMVIAELSTSDADVSRKNTMHAVVSNTIFIGGSLVLIVIIILLSSTLLPSSNLLILSIVLVAISGYFMFRSSVKIYAKAQGALQETFLQPADPLHKPEVNSIADHPILEDVKLESVTVASKTIGVKKLISEIKLRSETGASIIGIDRNGERIVNPDSDEELYEGDNLLLLGYREQLDAAKNLLSSEETNQKTNRLFPKDPGM